MRALSIKQPWAELIARGTKKIEYRKWKVGFREPLLVVASTARQDDKCREHGLDPAALVYGKAVCVVELADITGDEGDYEWHLRNPRRVEAVPITGYASVYHVDDAKIRYVDGTAPLAPSAAVTNPATKKARKKKAKDEGDDVFHPSNALENVILVAHADQVRLRKLVTWAKEALPGNEVVGVDGGKRAIDELDRLPQIVVAPAMLPGVSGLEVARKAGEHIFAKHASVILLADGVVATAALAVGLVLSPEVAKAEFIQTLRENSPLAR